MLILIDGINCFAKYINTPFMGIITASDNNVCPGTTITFSATTSNNASYLWYVNNVSTGMATSSFSKNTFQNNDQVSCYITDALGAGFSNVITVNVKSTQTPLVNISVSAVDICLGDQVVFNATAVNGGTSPVYQWKVNGVIVGTNLSTYITNALYNHDAITCTMLSNADCMALQQVSSYSIFMNVSDNAQPKGKIIATASSICQGTPVDFSMNMTVGAATDYQWKINGNNISTNSSFTANNLIDQDVISCDVLVNTRCKTGVPFSGSFIITVDPDVRVTVGISSSATEVCKGVPVTFTAVPTNAGNNISYQWKVNNSAAGTNNPLFITTDLKNNDVVTCQVTPKNIKCLVSGTAVSNNLVMKVFDWPLINMPILQSVTIGNSITLTPIVSGDIAQYTWSPATGLSSTTVKTPVATPTSNITYTLSVISSTGCTSSGFTSIKVLGGGIIVNNTFTPNADGINDTWNITNLVNYDNCTINVFNRNGTVVFHSIGYPVAWDGRFNNKMLPAGVYYYVISIKNGLKPLTGLVTIIK